MTINLSEVPVEVTLEGSFPNHRLPTDNRCGIGPVAKVFYFFVQINCSAANLDSRGFATDRREIGKFFSDSYGLVNSHKPMESCEVMALNALQHMLGLCPNAESVEVRIWATKPKGGYIGAKWSKQVQGDPR